MTRKLSKTTRIMRWLRSPSGAKLTHRAPASAVFAVGAYISYWHIVETVRRGHERHDSALLYPVIIDAVIVVSARYLSRSKTWIGKAVSGLGFLLGTGYTLYCNLLAAEPTPTGRIIGIAPGVIVIVTASILHWGESKPKPTSRTKPAVKTSTPERVNGKVHHLSSIASSN